MRRSTNVVVAGVAGLAVAAGAAAQNAAVQWRVEDGGNGHWYERINPATNHTWTQAKQLCESLGGHLATVCSSGEDVFIHSLVGNAEVYLGGLQSTGSCEPDCGWQWITGEQWGYTNWCAGEPNNNAVHQDFLRSYQSGQWDDVQDGYPFPFGIAIEWSADCNNDGIVDYGQCRDGSLPDFNGNNIPDCCEQGVTCAVGNYPVQWRVEDGGNGHWYSGVDLGHPVFWVEARDMASASGGHLATPSTAGEDHFLVTTFLASPRLYRPDYSCCAGPYIGASNEGAGWKWVDGTPWSYTNWYPGNPNEIPFTVAVYWSRPECQWQDQNDVYPQYKATAYIAEWSADCNNDGIVDYGQILAGQLADANGNNIPDCCEGGATCCIGDILQDGRIDGADLAAVLSHWGAVTSNSVSIACDLDHSGTVDGNDLGILLAHWGPCAP